MIHIREALPQEYAHIGALTVAAYEAGGILGTDPNYRYVLADAQARADEHALLVAVDHDVVVASVTYCPYGSREAEVSGPGEAEFRMLAVEPAFEGRGIGPALIAACEQRARDEGRQRLVLSVIEHNAKAARVYQRLGYRRAPHRDWEPYPGVDLHVWEKDL